MPKPAQHSYLKAIMIQKRERRGDRVKCDGCGRFSPVVHKHEVVNDNRLFTPCARMLAEDELLSVLLCPACHEVAGGKAAQFLAFNVRLFARAWGREAAYAAVKAQLAAVEDLLRVNYPTTRLNLRMPEWDEVWPGESGAAVAGKESVKS